MQQPSNHENDTKVFQMSWKHKLAKFFFKSLSSRFSRRFKRLFYISTVIGMIENSKDADMKLVQKVNDVFKLAKDTHAYELPIHFNKVVWTCVDPITTVCQKTGDHGQVCIKDINDRILTNDECEVLGEHIAKNVPDWLRYASFELMSNDVKLLIKQIQKFKFFDNKSIH